MNKKIRTLLIMILVLSLLCTILVGCDNKEDKPNIENKPNIEDEKEQTAYDKLTNDEKKLFDAFCIALDDFKNPSSVVFKKVTATFFNMEYAYLDIIAANSYGGSSSDRYILLIRNYSANGGYSLKKGTIMTTDDLPSIFYDAGFPVSIAIHFFPDSDNKEVWENVDNKTFSVAKLNAALKEYKTEQGYI